MSSLQPGHLDLKEVCTLIDLGAAIHNIVTAHLCSKVYLHLEVEFSQQSQRYSNPTLAYCDIHSEEVGALTSFRSSISLQQAHLEFES